MSPPGGNSQHCSSWRFKMLPPQNHIPPKSGRVMSFGVPAQGQRKVVLARSTGDPPFPKRRKESRRILCALVKLALRQIIHAAGNHTIKKNLIFAVSFFRETLIVIFPPTPVVWHHVGRWLATREVGNPKPRNWLGRFQFSNPIVIPVLPPKDVTSFRRGKKVSFWFPSSPSLFFSPFFLLFLQFDLSRLDLSEDFFVQWPIPAFSRVQVE